jgi:ATP-dependent DNA helicase RecG
MKLTNSQINDILKAGENQEVEFKESFRSSQETSKAICAFANTQGGLLIFGVDAKGNPIGLRGDLDKIQQEIAAANQTLSPPPMVSIETYKFQRNNLIIVSIQRSPDSISHTHSGVTYVRIGSTQKKLDGQNLVEFLRNRQILSFDESYEHSIKTSELDENKIKKYLKVRAQEDYFEDHTIEDFLLSNSLATQNGNFKIKNAAILLFTQNPTQYFSQAEVNLVKFSGNEPVDIVAHQLVQEDPATSIEMALAFAKKYLPRQLKISSEGRRNEIYEYPLEVVREAIVNAVAHRDYFSKDAIQIYIFDDRIEITNPGSLPKGLTKELFGTISIRRNPIIYKFLRDLGYVEGLGTGVPRMRNGMRKAGLGDPDFIFTETIFRVALHHKKTNKRPIESENDLNERQTKALEYLKDNKAINTKTYIAINNVSHVTALKDIDEMIQFDYLRRVGKRRGAYYVLK